MLLLLLLLFFWGGDNKTLQQNSKDQAASDRHGHSSRARRMRVPSMRGGGREVRGPGPKLMSKLPHESRQHRVDDHVVTKAVQPREPNGAGGEPRLVRAENQLLSSVL